MRWGQSQENVEMKLRDWGIILLAVLSALIVALFAR